MFKQIEIMKVEKLELKHLAHYLPYGLKCTWGTEEPLLIDGYEIKGDELRLKCVISDKRNKPYYMMPLIEQCKPILRPLSGLRMFVSFSVLDNLICVDVYTDKLTYIELSYLLQNHFDVFGLIPSGLAVDINTLNK